MLPIRALTLPRPPPTIPLLDNFKKVDMRVMAKIDIPAESGNAAIKDGRVETAVKQLAERWHPEAMYFGTFDGQREMFAVFDMADPSEIPVFAEPFFLGMGARVQIVPVMNGDDLQKGLSQISLGR
jgi:hypothetical protein